VSKTGWIGIVGGTLIVLAMILVFSDDPAPVDPGAEEQQAMQGSDGEAVQLPETPDSDDASNGTQSASDTQSDDDSESGQSAMGEESDSASMQDTESADTSGTTVEEDASSPEDAPSFDVIRIDRTGDAVIAGRAAPGAEVTLLDGDDVLGTVTADGRGEWVFLPSNPLEPGSHELRLRAQSEGMDPIFGGDAVVLVVPERGQDIAGRETDDPNAQEPLVLLIPDQDQPGVEVVQAPRADNSDEAGTETDGSGQQIEQTATAEPGGVQSSDGALAVDTIDYDPQGNIAIAGRGPSDSDIVAYLDNSPLGGSPVDADGNWRINPDREVAPGVYRMRLDALRGGSVISRLEIPFSRAEPLTDLDSDAFIVVQPGNSLWRIARRTLGTGFNYTIIYDANSDQIGDPDLIYPGQVFEIPR